MGSDLVALLVALTLGTAVVILGLRRNLSDITLDRLPRFGWDPERATATLGLYEGEERRRRPLSPRRRRWIFWGYLLISLANAALALLWANGRLFHAIIAALFALVAVALLLKKWPPSVDGSTS